MHLGHGYMQPDAVSSTIRTQNSTGTNPTEILKSNQFSVIPYDCQYHINSYNGDAVGFETKIHMSLNQKLSGSNYGNGRSGSQSTGKFGTTESSCPKPKDKDCVRHPRPPSPPNQMQINKDKNERLGIECDKMDRNMATTRAEMIAEAKANGNLNVLC